MENGSFDWAGVLFLAIDHHDGSMIHAPGLFAFVRRLGEDDRILLYVDHAEWIATAATTSHEKWAEALRLGMNELHVCLRAKAKLDRLQLRHHVIKRAHPILNILEAADAESLAPHSARASLQRRGTG
jgi:hypothetical protein